MAISKSSASMGKGGGYMPSKSYTSSKQSSGASLGKGSGLAVNPKGSLGPTRGNGSGYGLESSFRLPSYQGNMARPIQTNATRPQRVTAVPGGYGAQAFGMATPSQLPRPNVSQPQTMHPVNSAWRVSDTGPIAPSPMMGGRALLANGSSLGPTRGNGSNYGLDSGVRLPSFNGNVAGPATPARPSVTVAHQSPPHKEYYDRIQPEPTYRSQAFNANVADMAKNYGAYRSPSNVAPPQFADKTAGYQSAIDAARAAQAQSLPADYRISPSSYSEPAPAVHPEWQTDADESMARHELPNYGLGTVADQTARPPSIAGLGARPSRPSVSTVHPYGNMGVRQSGNRFPSFGQDVHFGGEGQTSTLGGNYGQGGSHDRASDLLTTPIGTPRSRTSHTPSPATRINRRASPSVPDAAISQPTQSTMRTRNLIKRSIMQNKKRRSNSHTSSQLR